MRLCCGGITARFNINMRVNTKEEAQKLTVPKLREELGHRGLSQEGLKVSLPSVFTSNPFSRTG